MRRLAALFALAIALVAGAPQSQAAGRVALVVGISSYATLPALDNPANDARLIADTLSSLGFTLVGGGPQLDLDKSGFDRAVQDFGRAIEGAEAALFYYAGHGVQVRGGNYLVPADANVAREADIDFQMLDAELVLRQMEHSGAALRLMILDACRNNPFGGGVRSVGSGLAQMRAPEGTLISFATQPGNVALDGEGGNSPYTLALAQTIARPGIDLFRAFNEIGLAVMRETGGAQQPWVQYSPISGEFYFSGRPAEPATAGKAGNEGDVAALQERLKLLEQQLREKDAPAAVATSPVPAAPPAQGFAIPAVRFDQPAKAAPPSAAPKPAAPAIVVPKLVFDPNRKVADAVLPENVDQPVFRPAGTLKPVVPQAQFGGSASGFSTPPMNFGAGK